MTCELQYRSHKTYEVTYYHLTTKKSGLFESNRNYNYNYNSPNTPTLLKIEQNKYMMI